MNARNIFLAVIALSCLYLLFLIGDNWNKGKVPLIILGVSGFWILMIKKYWRGKEKESDRRE